MKSVILTGNNFLYCKLTGNNYSNEYYIVFYSGRMDRISLQISTWTEIVSWLNCICFPCVVVTSSLFLVSFILMLVIWCSSRLGIVIRFDDMSIRSNSLTSIKRRIDSSSVGDSEAMQSSKSILLKNTSGKLNRGFWELSL